MRPLRAARPSPGFNRPRSILQMHTLRSKWSQELATGRTTRKWPGGNLTFPWDLLLHHPLVSLCPDLILCSRCRDNPPPHALYSPLRVHCRLDGGSGLPGEATSHSATPCPRVI